MKMSNYDIKNIYEWPFFIKILFFFIIAVMIFYIGFLFDLNNLRKYIVDSRKQEKDLLNQFSTIVNNKILVKSQISQLPELQHTLKEWEKKLITHKETSIILDHLIKIASQTHLQLNLLDPQNEVKEKFYSKIPIKMQLSGTFDQIGTFLSQIANMNKIIVIDNFTIAKNVESNIASPENKMIKTQNENKLDLILNLYKNNK